MELMSLNICFDTINVYVEVEPHDECAMKCFSSSPDGSILIEKGKYYTPGQCTGDQLIYLMLNARRIKCGDRLLKRLSIQPGTVEDNYSDERDPNALDVWMFF